MRFRTVEDTTLREITGGGGIEELLQTVQLASGFDTICGIRAVVEFEERDLDEVVPEVNLESKPHADEFGEYFYKLHAQVPLDREVLTLDFTTSVPAFAQSMPRGEYEQATDEVELNLTGLTSGAGDLKLVIGRTEITVLES